MGAGLNLSKMQEVQLREEAGEGAGKRLGSVDRMSPR